MNKPAILATIISLTVVAFWAGRGTRQPGSPTKTRKILYYIDPMHPSYRSDKSGTAPDCGMDLEPVYEGENQEGTISGGAVVLDSAKRSLIGLQTEKVRRSSGERVIRTSGRVSADENRLYRIVSATSGWVLEIKNNASGMLVRKDEVLATYYSNELRSTQTGYLAFLAIMDQLKSGTGATEHARVDDSLNTYEEQLRALGMSDVQIQELTKTRQITNQISLVSPIRGVVLSRSVSPQLRFEKGTEFYRIADLSKVWITGDLREDESILPRPNAKVRVEVREAGRSLYAKVSSAPPQFDPATRTFKIRLEAENPGLLLRPDMYVDLEFTGSAPAGISVPEEGVLDSNAGKIVYVETTANVFEPRSVVVGASYGNRIAIPRGLADGEKVVVSGTFLLDSESRMRAPAVLAQNSKDDSDDTRDPVCGMKINKNRAEARTETYKGKTYYFCSDRCRGDFKKDSAKYAAKKSPEKSGS